MTLDILAAQARVLAESLMRSTCTIRVVGEPATDPETGHVVAEPGDIVYTGPCRVRPASGPGGNSQGRVVAGDEVTTFDYLVSVPFTVTAVSERDRVTVTASPDSALVGVEIEVAHVDRGENISARRLQCREVA